MSKRDFYQISLKVFLKNQNGEVLILKACTDGSFAGFYDLPGGRIDEDEFRTPFAEIMEREIKEEIGGDIKIKINPQPVTIGRHLIPAHLTSYKKDLHVLYLFFEAEYLSGDIKISPEHINYKWVNLKNEDLNLLFKSGILEGAQIHLSS